MRILLLVLATCILAPYVTVAQQLPNFGKCFIAPAERVIPKEKAPQYVLPSAFRDSLFSDSGRFLIHYDAASLLEDSVTTLAYAQQAARYADSAYTLEVNVLGFTPPAFTTGTHYDIYLTPLHLNAQYGYPYGATFWLDNGELSMAPSGVRRVRSFSEIDNKFTDSQHYRTYGYDALRITIFHEFFHIIQFSEYGMPPNGIPNYTYFQEMSSVWMEWLSTPTVKDYLNYLPFYIKSLELRFDLSPANGYGQYIFFAYLSHRFGRDIVREIWETYRDRFDDPVTCIDYVLRQHGSSFCEAYEEFGSELIQTGRRFSGSSQLPDAQIVPVDEMKVTKLTPGTPQLFQTFGLSLQYFASGIGNDTCFAVIARDTDRMLQSSGMIEFFATGGDKLTLDSASAYCDTEVCTSRLAASALVFPNPLVLEGESTDSAYIQASTNPIPPVAIVLDIYSMNGIHIRHSNAKPEPVRETWNATWDGRDDLGKPVESGEYVYKLLVDGALKVGKIVVVRK